MIRFPVALCMLIISLNTSVLAGESVLASLDLIEPCYIRDTPKSDSDKNILISIEHKTPEVELTDHNFFWLKASLKVDEFWAATSCLNRIATIEKSTCRLYKESSTKTATTLYIVNQRHKKIEQKKGWTKIKLLGASGFIGSQCYGLNLMKSKQFLSNLEKFCQQGNASFCPQPKNEERVPASTPVEVFKPIERPQLTKKYRSTRISVGVLPTAFLYKQSGVTTPAYDFAKSSQSSFILGLNYEIQDGIQATFEWSNQSFSISRQNNSDIPFHKNDFNMQLQSNPGDTSIKYSLGLKSTQSPLLTANPNSPTLYSYTMIGPVAGVSLERLLFKTKTGVNLFYFYPVSVGSGYKNIYSSDFLLSVYARFQLTTYLDFVSTFGTNYQNFKINTSSTEFNADTLEQTSINYIFNFSLSTKF